MTIPTIVIIWVVCFAFCIVVLVQTIRFAIYSFKYVWPSNQIIIGAITEEGKEEQKWTTRFFDRWIRYCSPNEHLVSNYGFIEDLNLSAYVVLSKSVQEQQIDNLDLQVYGVNVSRLVNFLCQISKGPYRTITGNFAQVNGKTDLVLSLKERDLTLKTWQFEVNCQPNSEDHEQRMCDLIDEAIFALIDYVKSSSKIQRSGQQVKNSYTQLNVRALAAYHKGKHHLDEYFKTHTENDLESAQEQFRTLTYEAPGYATGFLLLGLALAEDRQEKSAIELFQRAKELTPSDAHEMPEIDLMIAKSRLRMYTWDSSIQSISELEVMKDALLKEISNDATRILDRNILLARVYAETAHNYGHLLVFLHYMPFKKAEESLNELEDFQDTEDSNGDAPPRLVQRIYQAHLANIKKTEELRITSNGQRSESIKARISEVKGYALFRYAQWIPPNNNETYRSMCEKAIQELKRAEVVNTMNYALLQNIGMIYLERRYDPQGEHIQTAERYYVRSNKLKPKDYYAYQQLALCGLRGSLGKNIEPKAEDIKHSLEYADIAIKLRKNSKSLQILYIQLLLTLWVSESDENRTQIEKKLETVFQTIEKDAPKEEQSWSLKWAKVFWLANKLKYTDPDKFLSLRQELQKMIDCIIQITEPEHTKNWVASQILSAAKDLRTTVSKIEYDTRHNLTVSINPSIE